MGSVAELEKIDEYGVPMHCMLVFKLGEVSKEEKGTNYHSLSKQIRKGQWVMKVVIQSVLYKANE